MHRYPPKNPHNFPHNLKKTNIFRAAKEHKLIRDARGRRDLRRAKAQGLDEEESYLPTTQKVMLGDAEMC